MYEAVNSALNAWWSYKASTKNPVVYRIESENGMSVQNLYQWFTSLPMGKVLKRHKPWLSIIFHISELFTKFFNYLEPGIVLDVLLSYKDFQHFVLSIFISHNTFSASSDIVQTLALYDRLVLIWVKSSGCALGCICNRTKRYPYYDLSHAKSSGELVTRWWSANASICFPYHSP